MPNQSIPPAAGLMCSHCGHTNAHWRTRCAICEYPLKEPPAQDAPQDAPSRRALLLGIGGALLTWGAGGASIHAWFVRMDPVTGAGWLLAAALVGGLTWEIWARQVRRR